MPEAKGRIPVFFETIIRFNRIMDKKLVAGKEKISYDIYINSILDFIENNHFTPDIIMNKKKIVWIPIKNQLLTEAQN